MARVPSVTRTIQTTKANVLCIDLSAEQPFTQSVILPRTYKDERSMLKKIKPMLENETVKVVHVQNFTVESTLYGMTEEEFIKAAEILPPRKTNEE